MAKIKNIEFLTKKEMKDLLNQSEFKNCNDLNWYLYMSGKADTIDLFDKGIAEDENVYQEFSLSYVENGSHLTINVNLGDRRFGKFQKYTPIEIRIDIHSNYKQGGFRVSYTPIIGKDLLKYRPSEYETVNLLFSDGNKEGFDKISPNETILDFMNRLYSTVSEYIPLYEKVTEEKSLTALYRTTHKYFKDSMLASFFTGLGCTNYVYINNALKKIGKSIDIEDLVILASTFINNGKMFEVYRTVEDLSPEELSETYDGWLEIIAEYKIIQGKDKIIADEYNKTVEKAHKEIEALIDTVIEKYGLKRSDLRYSCFFHPVKVAPEYYTEKFKEKELKK